MRKSFAFLFSVLFVSILVSACESQVVRSSDDANVSSSSDASFSSKNGALKIDPTTSLPQVCTPTGTSSDQIAVGPSQRIMCDPDGKVRVYFADDKVKFADPAGDPATDPSVSYNTISLIGCAGSGAAEDDSICAGKNPYANAENFSATCVVTENSKQTDGDPGFCFFAYKTCKIWEGTPCFASGVTICENSNCSCTAVKNTAGASDTELCDSVDNNCNGSTDEGFSVGSACDGSDSDKCTNGKLTCKSDKLGTECTNETSQNIEDVCDGNDNDCDGTTDEDYTSLGQACDGADGDQCKNGMVVCGSDKKSVLCEESGSGSVESCNGKDDTCDSKTDEGCDDDADGYCDVAMAATDTAACKPGDCNDNAKDINPIKSEACNNVDDNCNAQTDEGIGKGDACSDGVGECKVDGKKVCANDFTVMCDAVKKQSSSEVCDGKDNSCDGSTDEGCDDDKDGYCDSDMTMANSGATCKATDCNDMAATIFKDATEVCNNVDDDCDGSTDEGCDDDADGYCDSSFKVEGGAKCLSQNGKGLDCDDANKDVNPGVEEKCLTTFDDNCDGNTELKKDGTLACDSCANALKYECNKNHEIDMATLANTTNSISSYQCWTAAGAKTLSTNFAAKEVVLAPSAANGTKWSFKIVSTSGTVYAFRLHNTCQPEANTTKVTAYEASKYPNGTCATYSLSSVQGGVSGQDFVALDATSPRKVTFQFVCQ